MDLVANRKDLMLKEQETMEHGNVLRYVKALGLIERRRFH